MFGEEVFYTEEESVETKGQTRKLIKELMPYFMRFRTRIIVATIMLLVSTVLGLFGPILLRHAIDVDIKLGSLNGLIRTSLLYLFLQLVVYVIGYFQRISLALVGERAAALLKQNLYEHIINLPMQFFDKNPVGRLLTRVDSDTEAIKNLFNTTAVVITQDLVLLVGMSVVMSIINFKLFLIVFVLLPPFIYAFWWFQKKVRPVYLDIRRKIAEINNFTNESVQNLTVIQAFNREDYSSDKMERLNKEKFAFEYKGMKLWYRIWYLVDFGEVLGLALVLGVGGLWALKGLVTIGTLFLFASYITRLFMPLRGLSDQLNVMQRAFASAQRIFKIFESKTELQGACLNLPDADTGNNKIDFQNVFFTYQEQKATDESRTKTLVRGKHESEPVSTDKFTAEAEWILKDINFKVKKGEKIALVGMTGSGKTSIISLLLKFYTVQKGKILLDGLDICQINNQTLRREIGFVPQDIILFPGSVTDNLRLFDTEIPLTQVYQATEQIGIRSTVEKFPNGFDTDLIARGVNLSVGERQLLSFARALVRNPQILILDEATSSIDPYTEHLIQEGLHKLLQDRTAIIIAHRLATIQMVDRIIVIHKGSIVEQGTHHELLRQKGYYYRLYRLQYLNQAGKK